MTIRPAPPPRLRIAGARLLQAIGWAGVTGIGLLVLATVVGLKGWSKSRDAWLLQQRATLMAAAPSPSSPPPTSLRPPTTKLPARADVSMLVARIERATTGNGLAWNAADYRVTAATERLPAALEVRCSLKGPYPKVRASIVEILGSAPATTFREMSFSRPGVSSAEVDAKLTVVMFLDERAATDDPRR